MTTTIANSMNILIERPTIMISAKVPSRMKDLIENAANSLNMNSSQYIKLAIAERLEKDNKL